MYFLKGERKKGGGPTGESREEGKGNRGSGRVRRGEERRKKSERRERIKRADPPAASVGTV